mmetsp:Transcript_47971/g.148064  ORF Transcript_47971/g.148064 Transcript_47971/m.148064 type:complete len:315 (+) Transcript_47971:711-1655(+)
MHGQPGLPSDTPQALLVARDNPHHRLLRIVLLGGLELAHPRLRPLHGVLERLLLLFVLGVLGPDAEDLQHQGPAAAHGVPREHGGNVLELRLLVLHELVLGVVDLLLKFLPDGLLVLVPNLVRPPSLEDSRRDGLGVIRRHASHHLVLLLLPLGAHGVELDVELLELNLALLRVELALRKPAHTLAHGVEPIVVDLPDLANLRAGLHDGPLEDLAVHPLVTLHHDAGDLLCGALLQGEAHARGGRHDQLELERKVLEGLADIGRHPLDHRLDESVVVLQGQRGLLVLSDAHPLQLEQVQRSNGALLPVPLVGQA